VDFGSRDPHNLGAARIRSHFWSGIAVHSIQQHVLPGCAWHQLLCDRPILSIVVNEAGGHCEARSTIDEGRRIAGERAADVPGLVTRVSSRPASRYGATRTGWPASMSASDPRHRSRLGGHRGRVPGGATGGPAAGVLR